MSILKNKMLNLLEELEEDYEIARNSFEYCLNEDDLDGMREYQAIIDDLEPQIKEAKEYIETL